MKHIRYFETTSAFVNAYSNEYVEPWVSYTEENQKINYNKLIKTPLTFTILDDTYLYWHETDNGNIPFRIYVSVNGGNEFYVDSSSAYSGTPLGFFYAGDEITVRGENETYSNPSEPSKHAHFLSSGRVSVKGNIMSLIYKNNFEDKTYFPQGTSYNFFRLFEGLEYLVDASKLVLPAMTLTDYCYLGMFANCSSLTSAPTLLPATMLADYCYASMFFYCSSLTTAPALPATTLNDGCYSNMFYGCSSLTSTPALPATTLTNSCYDGMFAYCSSLTSAPALPATDLVVYCYNNMFNSCTSLTTAPELPATNLAGDCYYNMFYNCTSLTTAPELPATDLAGGCYSGMFGRCTSLTTAPELPATTLQDGCYTSMFFYCSKLNYIKCLATNISASNCTSNWVIGVASTGTFVKNPNMSSWTTGDSGIPSGWTTQNAS